MVARWGSVIRGNCLHLESQQPCSPRLELQRASGTLRRPSFYRRETEVQRSKGTRSKVEQLVRGGAGRGSGWRECQREGNQP